MSGVWLVAARRTAVAPRGGAFAQRTADELAAAVLRALCDDVEGVAVDAVVLGNALGAGGNPARVAALRAGLPVTIPAATLDTQCCAGMDAIAHAAARIAAGQARAIIAGGMESFSRAPLRAHRPLNPGDAPQPYARPPFTPWPHNDPDMIVAAATLAQQRAITRAAQEAFAIDSHRKARAKTHTPEIVAFEDVTRDAFARDLQPQACRRLPALAGDEAHALTAATIAVEADAAAAVILVDDEIALRLAPRLHARGETPLRWIDGVDIGADPAMPALAPMAAAQSLCARNALGPRAIDVVEIMEAFAAQAIAFIDGFGFEPARVNRGGGALARGHPIGASGAILAVRLAHELWREARPARGLAAIAAAGGLGSAIALERET